MPVRRCHPYIDPEPAALQAGPIADHPDVIPIRTVPWEDPLTEPVALPQRRLARPLVYVTFGTVVCTAQLLREVILEAAQIGDVIASTGPSVGRVQLGTCLRMSQSIDSCRPAPSWR